MDTAEELVRKAIRRNPQSRDAHFELARVATRRRRFDLAVKEGAHALKLPPAETTDRQIHALLARSFQALGDTVNATRHAQTAKTR